MRTVDGNIFCINWTYKTKRHKTPLYAPKPGYIQSIDGMGIATLGLRLKAGRDRVGDIIDPAVGIQLCTQPGKYIDSKTPWAIVHHNHPLEPFWIKESDTFLQCTSTDEEVPSRIITVLRK